MIPVLIKVSKKGFDVLFGFGESLQLGSGLESGHIYQWHLRCHWRLGDGVLGTE